MSLGQTIVERLKAAFPDVRLKLEDSGGGNHWDLTIASDALKGVSKVKQHQAIYKPLRDLIDSNEVHALKISVVALDDWEE